MEMDGPCRNLDKGNSSSKKKGKQCVAFGCSNTFYGPNGLPSSLHFFKFPKDTNRGTPMVQSHQTSAWERRLFRDKFNGGLLKTFSKRRHTENFNRPLGISVRFVFKRLYSSITTFFADHPNFDFTTTLFLSDIMFIGCSISTYISMKYTNKGHQDYKTMHASLFCLGPKFITLNEPDCYCFMYFQVLNHSSLHGRWKLRRGSPSKEEGFSLL